MTIRENGIAIVSGASSGIGQAIALKLSFQGYCLGLNSRSEPNLLTAFRTINPESILLSAGDISNFDFASNLVNSTVARFGGLNTLIVSAGVGYFGSFMDISEDLTHEIVQTNLMGSINLVKAALPHLTKNEYSDVVFISSTAGSRGGANEAVYAATKHAQNGLAGSLDREFRKLGVRVSVIAPGATRTNFASGTGRDASGDGQENYLDSIDVADAVAFALSLPKDSRIQYLSILPMSQQS
jgi:3-oxoacyl-[acyl-carrier protein] reductase